MTGLLIKLEIYIDKSFIQPKSWKILGNLETYSESAPKQYFSLAISRTRVMIKYKAIPLRPLKFLYKQKTTKNRTTIYPIDDARVANIFLFGFIL